MIILNLGVKEWREKRVKNIILLFLVLFSTQSNALNCQSILEKTVKITYENISDQVKYMFIQGEKLPYLDLTLQGCEKGTVFIISGFGKNMNSWVAHINLLLNKRYRVILYAQSNVGRNLLENGILHFDFGEGLNYDAQLGKKLLQKLKPKKIIVVGYSRGAWVASKIVDLLAEVQSIKIKRLVLASPYVEYFWKFKAPGFTGYFFDRGFNFMLALNPGVVGLSMGAFIKHSYHEEIKGVLNNQRDRALGYILKGTNPGNNKQESTLFFILKAIEKGIKVKVITSQNDQNLAPLKIVKTLDVKGVDFNVLSGHEYSHYWPQTHPNLFVEKILTYTNSMN